MTTLIYLSGAETHGVHLDREQGILSWFEAVGSTCGDDGSSAEQDVEAFVRRGPPAGAGHVPDETLRDLLALVGSGP